MKAQRLVHLAVVLTALLSLFTRPGSLLKNAGISEGCGLALQGSAYVTFGDPDKLDLPQFTIETWFKRTGSGTASSTGAGGIASAIPLVTHGYPEKDGSVVDGNWFLVIDAARNVIAADFEDMAGGANHPVYGVTPITSNAWHHAAAAYDGATWWLYLDGQLETTLAVNAVPRSDTIEKAALGAMLGSNGAPAGGRFQGVLDEVRIWTVARSQAEILRTLNRQLPGGASGLVARWGFDEGRGAQVGDSVAPAASGTLTGGTYAWVAGAPFNLSTNQRPAAPQLAGPAGGAINDAAGPQGAAGAADATDLSVSLSDPDGDPLNVTFYGRPLDPSLDFSLVVLPDTQYYAAYSPEIFYQQMQWVMDHQLSENIPYVASLGDTVDKNTDLDQFAAADAAYRILDAGGVPYGVAAGNHDGAPDDTANFNTFFGPARYAGKPGYGGHYGADNDNFYSLFEASGYPFIVIYLEYDETMLSADDPRLAWANALLHTYRDRRAIVVSHDLLYQDGNFSGQGQAIYNALKANPNLFLMLAGHWDVAARRAETYNGHTIYILRSDYQFQDDLRSGYLRILRFSPATDTIHVRTYSPTLDQDHPDAANNDFNLPYPMGGAPFQVIGSLQGVPSGSTATITWRGLDPAMPYQWYAVASDASHSTSSATWSFTTTGGEASAIPKSTMERP